MKLRMTLSDHDQAGRIYECNRELTDIEIYQFRNGGLSLLIQTFHELEKQLHVAMEAHKP